MTYSRVARVSATPPEQGAYLSVTLRTVAPTTARFAFPVDRFYLPEQQAPVAERAHGEAQRGGRDTWAEIRVHEGRALIEQLYVAPVWIGRGLGRRFIELARERRAAGLDLYCFAVNASARAFYERMGFAAVGFGDGNRNAERQPEIRYAWRPNQ